MKTNAFLLLVWENYGSTQNFKILCREDIMHASKSGWNLDNINLGLISNKVNSMRKAWLSSWWFAKICPDTLLFLGV